MNERPVQRRLAAILAADVVGYSRMMGSDEVRTLRALQTSRREVVDRAITSGQGRIVKTTGDGILAEFSSAVDAVTCAVEIQRTQAVRNGQLPPLHRLVWRIGINAGDVIVEGADIFGDGVNVAARLESLCEPGGICISRVVRDQVRDRLPVSFDDLGDHVVKNIARPVRAYGLGAAAAAAAPQLVPTSVPWVRRKRLGLIGMAVLAALAIVTGGLWWSASDRPIPFAVQKSDRDSVVQDGPEAALATIVVLPFASLAEGGGSDYFADGLTEDIIAALGKFRELSVTSRSGAFAFKGRSPTPNEIGRDLNVRYVVEGSVRRASDRVRVTVSLTDTSRGTILWSERYEAEPKDIFAVQDNISRQVSGALAVRVTSLELARSAAKPPSSLEAYDLVLRGRDLLSRVQRSTNAQARALFERAIELDPDYASAYVGLGRVSFLAVTHGWAADASGTLAHAERLARQAIDLDDSSPGAHALLGTVLVYFGDYEGALDALNRAIERNPSDTEAYEALAGVALWRGDLGGAIHAAEMLLRFKHMLSTTTAFHLGTAYVLSDRANDAVRILHDAAERNPGAYAVSVMLAAAYAAAGRSDDAVRQIADIRQRFPLVEQNTFGSLLRDAELRDKLMRAIQRAGL